MQATDTLSVDVAQGDQSVVITPVGTASMDLYEGLAAALVKACELKPPVLVIDLEKLDFICSLGLGCLVVAHVRVRRYGGKMTLANPTAPIRDMLAATKLATLMPIYDSTEDALAAG